MNVYLVYLLHNARGHFGRPWCSNTIIADDIHEAWEKAINTYSHTRFMLIEEGQGSEA